MMLAGLSQQASKLDREKMQTQLQSVTAILEICVFYSCICVNWNKRVWWRIQILLKELEEKWSEGGFWISGNCIIKR